jgi:hypothetical protein
MLCSHDGPNWDSLDLDLFKIKFSNIEFGPERCRKNRDSQGIGPRRKGAFDSIE